MKFTLDMVQNGVIITKEDVDYKNETKITRVVFPSMFSAIDWVKYESKEPEGLPPRFEPITSFDDLYGDGY